MNDNDLIYRYEAGELTATQRTTFEKRLQQEPALRKALELYRDVAIFADIKSNASLQIKFNELGDAHFGAAQEKKRILPLKRFFMAVAAVFLLAFTAWWLLLPPKHTRLYNQVAHADLSIATKIDNQIDIQKMETLYNTGDYQQAIPLLQTYSEEHPNALSVKIALSVALIEEENYDLAADFLTELKKGDSAYKWEATFYLALLYLKQGKMDVYNNYLDEIPANSPVYKRVKGLRE